MSGEDWAPVLGEIIWMEFGPTAGTEQAGRRPALVLSDDGYNVTTGRAVVMPITSRVRSWAFEVRLSETSPIRGAVMADQVRCIDWRARHAKSAGHADAGVIEEARGKLCVLIAAS